MILKMIQSDLDNAAKDNDCDCPVARMLKRYVCGTIRVGVNFFITYVDESNKLEIDLPFKVTAWIAAWDAGWPVELLEVEIDVPLNWRRL